MRVCFILLSLLGTIPAAPPGPGLDCTNDYDELMTCNFQAQNCSQYSLTLLQSDGTEMGRCVFRECDHESCSCDIHMKILLYEYFNATVWKGNKFIESKFINITASVKPKTPTIVSLRESNGNIEVKWRTNAQREYLDRKLAASVTYYKKGHTEKVTTFVDGVGMGGLKYYEIPGQALEPSTTYVVSVRSYLSWSGKHSDSSQEEEFTTASSPRTHRLVTIVTLSTAAVIITSAVIGCYYRVKSKWLHTVAKCPKPKLLHVHPGKEKGDPLFIILKPLPTDISSVSVHPASPSTAWSNSGSPEQRTEIRPGSSSPSYEGVKPADITARVQEALSKTFTLPLTSVSVHNPEVRADDSNSLLSTDFSNMTYFFDAPGVGPQPEMACDWTYRSTEPQPQASPLTPADVSNHQCSTNANAADVRFSSVVASSGPVPEAESGSGSADGARQPR